jgi:ketosteroid isomerase-like protein
MGNCSADAAALNDLLDTEYAFGRRARDSIRTAFLEYLAEDSWVLHPAPTPARALYEAARENGDSLEWYPSVAELAGSFDLGFTTGPFIYTAADGRQTHGHFMTIWKRDSACRWRVQFDGGISHPAAEEEAKLTADRISFAAMKPPAPTLIAEDAASRAISDFQDSVRLDDFAAGLRTYARTADFRFYTEGEAPMTLGTANRYLTGHPAPGAWQEDVRGRSGDCSLAYCAGVLRDSHQAARHAYTQIWRYDPRVANWGLRLLLTNPLSN